MNLRSSKNFKKTPREIVAQIKERIEWGYNHSSLRSLAKGSLVFRYLLDNEQKWEKKVFWWPYAYRNSNIKATSIIAKRWTTRKIRKWLKDYKDVFDQFRRFGYHQAVFSTLRDVRKTAKRGFQLGPFDGREVTFPK